MSIIDDLRNAITNYPTDHVDVSIVDFEILENKGPELNIGDKAKFKVKVENKSCLQMDNVAVAVNGTNFADVSRDNIHFITGPVSSSSFTVIAWNNNKSSYLYLKCKAKTTGPKDIVSARVDRWDANLIHLLRDHSNAGPYEGKLNKEIFPS
jgi:hypothetical protein